MTALTNEIRREHLSGRFTATEHEEAVAVDHALAWCDIFSTTEVSAGSRSKALRHPDFYAISGNKGPRDDCGLAVRKSRFELLEGGTRTLSSLRYKTERHELADTTEGAYGVVRDRRTNKVGVIVVVHMPHGMQDDLRTRAPGSDVAKAYRGILRGARKLANELAHNYHADWVEVVGDWNLNLRSLWVPIYLKAQFPGYHTNWARPFPKRGTFHDQIIDIALVRGAHVVAGPRLVAHEDGFDHGGWRMTVLA